MTERPPALFPLIRLPWKMGWETRWRLGTTLMLGMLLGAAIYWVAHAGGYDGNDYLCVLGPASPFILLLFGPTLMGLAHDRRRAQWGPGARIAPLTAPPMVLEPRAPAILRGIVQPVVDSGDKRALLSALIVHTPRHPRRILLRDQRGGDFLVRDAEGTPHLVTGTIHLLVGDEPGDASDAREIAGWAIDETVAEREVRVHRLDAGDFVEVWGTPHSEQLPDGYRDAAVRVLRGSPGAAVLVRRVAPAVKPA
jgi:hypothetical protein